MWQCGRQNRTAGEDGCQPRTMGMAVPGHIRCVSALSMGVASMFVLGAGGRRRLPGGEEMMAGRVDCAGGTGIADGKARGDPPEGAAGSLLFIGVRRGA